MRKFGADKIVLLGMFVVALLTARFIVAFKSALVLSEPIKLTRTGLSLSIPTGNGWQSAKGWKYQDNVFALGSEFALGSGRPTAWAYCQYLLAARRTTPQTWFAQSASEVGGDIVETGQMRTDTLTVYWAYIQKPGVLLDMYLGTAELPGNRWLDIEVREISGDADLAERTFNRVVDSVDFRDNQLLIAGAEVIADIKSKGLDRFLDNQNQQILFLIEDARRRTIGFTMDVLVDSGSDAPLNIDAAGLFYLRGRNTFEQVGSFQSDNNFDEFVWKSEAQSPTRRTRTEIILDKDGLMTVRKFAALPEEKDYYLSPAAIPDVLFHQLLNQMLDSDKKEIVVDLIEADGKITPTFVSEIETEEDIAADEEAAHVVKLELLDGRGFSEHIYFDDQKQIYKRLVQQEDIYILESATIEDIVREFPERADYTLKKNKMLR